MQFYDHSIPRVVLLVVLAPVTPLPWLDPVGMTVGVALAIIATVRIVRESDIRVLPLSLLFAWTFPYIAFVVYFVVFRKAGGNWWLYCVAWVRVYWDKYKRYRHRHRLGRRKDRPPNISPTTQSEDPADKEICARVFVSYSRADEKFVRHLAAKLRENYGLSLWIDRDGIGIGDDWDKSIHQALSESTSLLLVLSPDSVSSNEVQSEWLRGFISRTTIVPLMYRQCHVPRLLEKLNYLSWPESNAAQESVIAAVAGKLVAPAVPVLAASDEGFTL